MFPKTNNPYQFKYLQTGITGEGIKEVYLPTKPKASEILFKKEQKWVRPEMPAHLKKAAKEWLVMKVKEPDYIHPLSIEITAWEDQEWDRSTNGIWFWNNGVPTFITGFYYWYLSSWKLYFGYPIYRETDKEITYWIQWWEENPEVFGGGLCTIRRAGKSSVMGGWLGHRTTRNHNHFSGCQGENDDKIKSFYNTMVLAPFRKLPYYYTPTFDTSSEQNDGIKFTRPVRRAKDISIIQAMNDQDDDDTLGSELDYRNSKENAYDQAVLHSYVMEECGKTMVSNVSERWDFVKPCLRRGVYVRGKAFLATTVEFMDTAGKGGKAFKELFFNSDVDDLQADGRTKSGLVMAFLPGDCAYEGFFDEWGHPMRDRAKRSILIERDSVKNNPKKHSALIRKYPLTVKEIFWINAEDCEFNATVLQDRLSEIDYMVNPIISKLELSWRNNERFSEVIWKHSTNGWLKVANVPWILGDHKDKLNAVQQVQGIWTPKNDNTFASGVDPVDHGVVITTTSRSDDEFKNSRRSRPVLFVKTKYDAAIDGMLTQEILEQRAEQKYQYKTNRYFVMMDTRPNDPNVYFERSLMIAWLFGVSLHVENQKPGLINYFHEHNCGNFILSKYVPEYAMKPGMNQQDGSAASTLTIQEYTSCKATYIEYFGHTIPFKELLEDDLQFNPRKTTEFDYSVASGWTELACKMRPKVVAKPLLDLSTIMPTFDSYGNRTN